MASDLVVHSRLCADADSGTDHVPDGVRHDVGIGGLRSMAINLEHLEDALVQFRLDIIERLSELSIGISVLELAILESGVPKARLIALRKACKKNQHRFRDIHTQGISHPHAR